MVEIALSIYEKRNKWTWVARGAISGALVPVAAISGNMDAAACDGGVAALASPTCWITTAISIVSSAAAAVAFGSSGAEAVRLSLLQQH